MLKIALPGIVLAVAVYWLRIPRSDSPPWQARGRSVLVTGASSGIGKELALAYANLGARLLITARRAAQLEEVKRLCLDTGASEVHVVIADVGEPEDWSKVGRAAAEVFNGSLDLLILNAGLSMGNTFQDLHETRQAMSVTEKLMRVNYIGAVGILDATMSHLLQSGTGVRIAVVSSLAGVNPAPLRTAYCASKHALHGFFDSLRMELLEHPAGSRITILTPGLVQTEINQGRAGQNERTQHLNMEIALPAAEAAARMVKSISLGQRELSFELDVTLKGRIMPRVISFLRMLAPDILDRLAFKTIREVSVAQSREE